MAVARLAALSVIAVASVGCVQPARLPAGVQDPALDGSWSGREDRSVSAYREWHLNVTRENVETMRTNRVVPGKGYFVNENDYRCDVSFIMSLDPAALRGGAHPRVSLAIAGTNDDCVDRRFTFYGVLLDPASLTGEVRDESGDFVQLALKKG